MRVRLTHEASFSATLGSVHEETFAQWRREVGKECKTVCPTARLISAVRNESTLNAGTRVHYGYVVEYLIAAHL